MEPKSVDFEQLKSKVLFGLKETLSIFLQARKREGEALAVVLNNYCDRIVDTVKELEPKIPEIIANMK